MCNGQTTVLSRRFLKYSYSCSQSTASFLTFLLWIPYKDNYKNSFQKVVTWGPGTLPITEHSHALRTRHSWHSHRNLALLHPQRLQILFHAGSLQQHEAEEPLRRVPHRRFHHLEVYSHDSKHRFCSWVSRFSGQENPETSSTHRYGAEHLDRTFATDPLFSNDMWKQHTDTQLIECSRRMRLSSAARSHSCGSSLTVPRKNQTPQRHQNYKETPSRESPPLVKPSGSATTATSIGSSQLLKVLRHFGLSSEFML